MTIGKGVPMSSDPVPVNKASKFDESKVKRSNSGQFSSSGGGGSRGNGGSQGGKGDGGSSATESASDRAGKDLTVAANQQHKKKLARGRAMRAWAEKKAAERKATKEGKSGGMPDKGAVDPPKVKAEAASPAVATGRDESPRTDPLLMGRPGSAVATPAKPAKPPAKATGFRSSDAGGGKAVMAKPSGPTTITPKQRKRLNITTTSKVLENRGYRLGRAYIGGGKNGFKASYDVHGPKGEKYRVEAKALGDWLMKKPSESGPPPEAKKSQAKATPKATPKAAPKVNPKAAPKTKPASQVEAPGTRTAKPAAPPKKVAGPIGPSPSAKTPTQAVVSQAKNPGSSVSAKPAAPKSGPAKPAKPAGKVAGPIRRSDEVVDAQVVRDNPKKPAAPPKKVTGPISAAGTAGNPIKAEMVLDGSQAPQPAAKPTASPAKSQPSSRRLRPGLRRGPAVTAQAAKPSHHQVAMGSRRIANVVGLPHQPGPGGSRIVGGGLSQVHAALKDAGFAAVQAFRTRMGPVVDYHSAARGVTARVMRSAGRTGRTAIRLLGEVTGLRKDAGMDFQELHKSAMDTLIALAGSPADAKPAKPRCPKCGSLDVSSHDKKATMWQCSTNVENGCGHRWDGNAKTGMLIAKAADMLGCAMVRLPQPLVDAVVRMQASIDPNDVIGWEDTPHVTLRYGVRANADQLGDALRDVKSITFTLGGFDIFVNDEQEVLFVRAVDDAGELAATRKKIEDGCPCDADTHPEYVPHVTIAYLKPGNALKYLELDNPLSDVKVTSYAVSYQTKAMVGLLKSAATGEPISKEAAKSRDESRDEIASIMPDGTEHQTHRHGLKSASWMAECDDGGFMVSSTIEAAEKAGFEQSSRKVSRHQDGSMMTVREVYLHPDGHKLTVNREIMEADMPAFHSLLLTSKPKTEDDGASSEADGKSSRKKSRRKLTKCNDAPWDCEAARGRLELWASDGEAFDLNNATHRQRYGQGFAAVVGDGTSRADYLYPHHDVVAGSLAVNRSAALAVMGALSGAADASGSAPLTKADVSAVLEHLRRDVEKTTEG